MDKSKPKERSTDTKAQGLTTPVAESPKTPVMDKTKQKETSTDTKAQGQKTPVADKSKPKEKSADTIKGRMLIGSIKVVKCAAATVGHLLNSYMLRRELKYAILKGHFCFASICVYGCF